MRLDSVWFGNHIFFGLLEKKKNQSRLGPNGHPLGKQGLCYGAESERSTVWGSTRSPRCEHSGRVPARAMDGGGGEKASAESALKWCFYFNFFVFVFGGRR